MWCTRWFLPLLLLPLPTAPPFFLLLFLFSLTLHAKPCFYCIVLLTTLFVTSCYWQPLPLDTPLSIPWAENITTFAQALNASLPTNFSHPHPLPTVIRAVDRCWCDVSGGSIFEPFNVSHWEYLSVMKLKNELERSQHVANLQPNATVSSNATDAIATSAPASSSSPPSSLVSSTILGPSRGWSLLAHWLLLRDQRMDARKVTREVASVTPETVEQPWLRKEYDLRPHGFDVVLDLSW